MWIICNCSRTAIFNLSFLKKRHITRFFGLVPDYTLITMSVDSEMLEVVVGRSLEGFQVRSAKDRQGVTLRHKGAWRRVTPYDR